MDRRTRNQLCTWLIVLGLGNFMVYAIGYAIIGGDAPNGYVKHIETGPVYYVRGHFVHRQIGYEQDVPKWVWVYSYVHSISIWPSIAAVLLAMLVLARPHIMATYQRGMVSGVALITIMATVIVLVTTTVMILFIVDFIRRIT
ncbi:MAG: hypothetical protein HS101_14690 [Planctomycetia bacterium]|nr:hypothetical protein [Planctomycetia bacterium]MCC7313190.1 hypothetical protein [Planctomycetota bacterium]